MAQALDRVMRWLGQRWCGLVGGHWFLVTREEQRLTLVCNLCGYKGRGGWDLTQPKGRS